MAKKKIQIFISSTYLDMKVERQACVEAILKSGHIPAGMELFTANDRSQLEIIKRWIDDSDILVLLLGGRYGTLETRSQYSYTELEYRYAIEQGKTVFAIIQTDESLEKKEDLVDGISARELVNIDKYLKFKEFVQTEKLCAFYDDAKDIRYELAQTVNSLISEREFDGWISGRDVQGSVELQIKRDALLDDNKMLQSTVELLKAQLDKEKKEKTRKTDSVDNFNGLTFRDLKKIFSEKIIDVPLTVSVNNPGHRDLLNVIYSFSNRLVSGVTTSTTASQSERWIYYNLALPLVKYGIVEHVSTPANVMWKKLRISSQGNKFLVLLEQDTFKNRRKKPKNALK